ncbi:MAG: hypothetical protein JXB48_05920 [Candidatus Latescibacteria bacterium]|nr:hypothetical protein [Candidatus Latescibacterota bacterium]
MPNIPRYNNINGVLQNQQVQNTEVRGNTQQNQTNQQNAAQNQAVTGDNYTQSEAAQRLQELVQNRQTENTVQPAQNQPETQQAQPAATTTEPSRANTEANNQVNDQITVDRRRTEAIQQYQQQTQTAVNNQNNAGANNIGLLG